MELAPLAVPLLAISALIHVIVLAAAATVAWRRHTAVANHPRSQSTTQSERAQVIAMLAALLPWKLFTSHMTTWALRGHPLPLRYCRWSSRVRA